MGDEPPGQGGEHLSAMGVPSQDEIGIIGGEGGKGGLMREEDDEITRPLASARPHLLVIGDLRRAEIALAVDDVVHAQHGNARKQRDIVPQHPDTACAEQPGRSEEHTSELQSLMRISYAVFRLKKKKTKK